MIRVAVVGCGIGRAHIEGYQALPDRFEVEAICDLDRAKAEKLGSELGIARIETDIVALLPGPAIDVVDLCNPPATHFRLSEQVLRDGKNAICEKPLVGSL